jgi:hypothetical protein
VVRQSYETGTQREPDRHLGLPGMGPVSDGRALCTTVWPRRIVRSQNNTGRGQNNLAYRCQLA